MSPKLRVAIGGASGQTGLNIVTALLAESAKFKIIALVRPESVDKEVFVDLQQRGVAIRAVAFTDLPAVVAALEGVDIVISCLAVEQKEVEIGLIHAAKQAEVGRCVPSFFATVCPPRGVQSVRDAKEDLLDHIRRLYLPYTVIDVGWWYQLSVPLVPSGKLNDLVSAPAMSLAGQGDTQNAFTDNRDIGKYVARIIADERTINKHVFVYNEVSTQEAIWSKVEELMDESIPRKYVSSTYSTLGPRPFSGQGNSLWQADEARHLTSCVRVAPL
ncbi:hypothetical protein NLU13_5734 [Sarocladium strictum]|uniref:NmrA-like domain-containing protein n=1 Tax=Sarocladium strictum TaxID=5046 RepID=A0AA39L7X5_SARSR|nr:hypothetical protein NLU13_5734 [Sarocladium strictum]